MRRLAWLFLLLMLGATPARSAEVAPSSELVGGIRAYNQGDFATARRLLEIAANRGEPQAMVDLGYMNARGHGGPVNSAHALVLHRRAAEMGDGEALNAVGYRYQYATPPDLANAVVWYCRAVARGNSRGMNNLAVLLWHGWGIAQDQEDARHLWRQAVAAGSVSALTNLGQATLADPRASDDERAAILNALRAAALKGSSGAQSILRGSGDTEAFPPAIDESLPMRLEPLHPVPGSSRACGDLVS